MKTLLLIHGPNLNLLGRRDQSLYGNLSLKSLVSKVRKKAGNLGFALKSFQSNYEGALIDFLQKRAAASCGIIINPGALTHYSYALHDALLDSRLPCVEVHLSNINSRENWRKISVTAPACRKVISGKKLAGYFEAVEFFRPLAKV